MANQVKLTFAGDATSLQKTFTTVGADAKTMSGKVDTASTTVNRGFDKMGSGADAGEQRIVGLRDAFTGTGDVMKGFKEGNIEAVLTGFADLGSSIANFVVPALKRMVVGIRGVNLAMLANPVGIVVAGIAAFAAILFVAWKKSETFRKIVTAAFEAVKSVVMPIIDGIGGAIGWLGDQLGFGGGDADEFEHVSSAAALRISEAYDTMVAAVSGVLGTLSSAVKSFQLDQLTSMEESQKILRENQQHWAAWAENIKIIQDRFGRETAQRVAALGEDGIRIADDLANANNRTGHSYSELLRQVDAAKGGVASFAREVSGAFAPGTIGGALIGGGGLLSLPGFAAGGVVGGALGQPQLAVVHGGETITPPGRGGGTTVVFNLSGVGMGRDFGLAVAQVIRDNRLIGVT